MLKSYLKKIFKTANQGDAREESYYATLEELFKKIAQSFGKGKIHITTVPIGYADGFNRLLSSLCNMLVCGCKAPIIGRVCMDMTMLDVGDIPEVSLEDEVVIFGKQGDASITVDEIASSIHTINYEIVSTIADRVPRIYLK